MTSLRRAMWMNKGLMAGLIIVLVYIGTGAAVYVSHLLGVQITPYNPIQEFVAKDLRNWLANTGGKTLSSNLALHGRTATARASTQSLGMSF